MAPLNELNKLSAIKEYNSGYSITYIADRLGVKRTTLSDFLRRRTHKRFWEEYLQGSTEVAVKINQPNKWPVDGCSHLVIPDTQVKNNVDLDYLSAIGEFAAEKMPEVIVMLGDFADIPSLSRHNSVKDKEGLRLIDDILIISKAMGKLLSPIQRKQDLCGYTPKMVMIMGNHDNYLDRYIDDHPELEGIVGNHLLRYEYYGWEVVPFLEVKSINGVNYIHYPPNELSGRPIGGSAENMLNKLGASYTTGHVQKLKFACRSVPQSPYQQMMLVAGACYVHDERFKGCNNNHWRGVILKDNVVCGQYNPQFILTKDLIGRYLCQK